MKNLIHLLFIISFIISCHSDESTNNYVDAYYQFEDDDLDKILSETYEINNVLLFKNQNDEEFYFKVVSNSTFVETLSEGMGFFGGAAGTYFDFDKKIIELEPYSLNYGNYSNLKIEFKQFPNNFEQAKSDQFTLYPSSLRGIIRNFPSWNNLDDDGFHSQYLIINFNDYTEMTINGTLYSNVFTISSNNSNGLNGNINVQTIYYDIENGIIGFNEFNGNVWELEN